MGSIRHSRSGALAGLAIIVSSLGSVGCSSDGGPGPSTGGTGGGNTAGASGALGSAGRTGGSGGAQSGAGGTGNGSAGRGGTGTAGAGVAGASAGAGAQAAGTGGVASGGGGTGGAGALGGKGGTAGTGGTSGGAGAASGNGGTGGGTTFDPVFILGADISSVQESNSTFKDTDGKTKTIFEVLKNHGFNYIRLKTFVDPSAPYGYASKANGCSGLSESFGDRDHVIAYGKQAKDAGMGFLLNFHYSDVWADPGNQIIPAAWRDATTVTDLASRLKAYTKDVITKAIAAGARPDMVQVGNEITPGMLAHVPGSNTDCWGNNPAPAPAAIAGSTSSTTGWNNLATLLKAGIAAVREVDPSIQVMLHLENTKELAGVRSWVNNALQRDVEFDILGLSCYVAFQGSPDTWEATFEGLATSYPELKFTIAEYNPQRTRANMIMKDLPNGRGLGTFFWEPTREGEWGQSMFTWQGNTATAKTADFAEYDTLRTQLGL